MKMKVADIIRKADDETMAKIIGAVIAMQTQGIDVDEAMEMDYPEILKVLQTDVEVIKKIRI